MSARSPTTSTPKSPGSLPDLAILPTPLAADALPVGLLVCQKSHLNPSTLEDRDYDDVGARWYKDVITVSSQTGKFAKSLGASHYVSKPPDGIEVGTIEATEMRVRLLKDPSAALKKVVGTEDARKWLGKHKEKGWDDVCFVTAVREVTNASYKRARLVDRGIGNWEVVREVGGEGEEGKGRRRSSYDVDTRSKKDIVGVEVRKVNLGTGEAVLGDVVGEEDTTALWA